MRLNPKAGYVIGGIAGLAATAALFLFLIIRKPYLEVTEVRASSVPLLVEVTWFLSCEEDYFEGSGNLRYQPQLPAGGEYPYVHPVMHAGTRFVFMGYPYTEHRRNRFTGNVETERSERFDLIEWHVLPPYVTSSGDEGMERYEPVGWKSGGASAQFVAQPNRSREGC